MIDILFNIGNETYVMFAQLIIISGLFHIAGKSIESVGRIIGRDKPYK